MLDKQKQEEEFIHQVMQSQGIIHKISRMYCRLEEDRQDLFQEILIQLWKAYPSFRGDAKFSTWMYRVGLNVALQFARKDIKKPGFDDIDQASEVLDIPEEGSYKDQKGRLLIAIGRLNEIEKAIAMLYLEEKSYEEISEIMGITQNYVRVKMNRIKNKLKELLKPNNHGV